VDHSESHSRPSAKGAALNSRGRQAVDHSESHSRASAEGAALNSRGREAVDRESMIET
jgi:hypothetical protein